MSARGAMGQIRIDGTFFPDLDFFVGFMRAALERCRQAPMLFEWGLDREGLHTLLQQTHNEPTNTAMMRWDQVKISIGHSVEVELTQYWESRIFKFVNVR